MENTITAKIKVSDIKTLFSKSKLIQEKINSLINKAFIDVDKRIISFASMDASERYLDFLENNRDIAIRVKQEYIASYLGITPSSLCRIKHKFIDLNN